MAKRKPRAQVRKSRDRDRRGSWDWRSALGSAGAHGERFRPEDEEEFTQDERVVPRGARERSPRLADTGADSAEPAAGRVRGVVGAFRGQTADVRTSSGTMHCAVRGRLETDDTEDRTLLVVGDEVDVLPTGTAEGVVERRLPRRTVLVRADKRVMRFRHVIAVNIDKVVLIASYEEPAFRPGIIDRFLVAASSQNLPSALIINKADLATGDDARTMLDGYQRLYTSIGIDVVLASAVTRIGLADVERMLSGCRAVLVGHSGVGKSTLLNALDPELRLTAREVNRKTFKGTHATSVAQIVALSSGIEVVDTPGLRELEIIGVSAINLEAHFVEFLPILSRCEMENCAHTAEPGCAVKQAVEDGTIHLRRYQSYLDIRRELAEVERGHERP